LKGKENYENANAFKLQNLINPEKKVFDNLLSFTTEQGTRNVE
jgi:hypothetical protein